LPYSGYLLGYAHAWSCSGVRTSLRAVARGRKTGKSRPNPTNLFADRVSQDCTFIEGRVFDEKHAIFLLAKPRHGCGCKGGSHTRAGFATDQEQRTERRLPAERVPSEKLFNVTVIFPVRFQHFTGCWHL